MLLLVKVKKHIARHRLQSTTSDSSTQEIESSPSITPSLNNYKRAATEESVVLEESSSLVKNGRTEDAIMFEDVGHSLFGWWGRFLVDLCILSSQIGFCVVYQIFLGDTIHGLLPTIPKVACLLIPVPVLIAVCQIRRLKWLAATSFIALFVFGIGFVICLAFSWKDRSSRTPAPYVQTPPSASSFATLISFAVFSFEGIGLVLPLQNSIRADVEPIFERLFSATVAAVTILYTLVGALGYVAWGSEVGASLLDNVIRIQGNQSVFVIIVLCGFLIGAFCSYPLNMYPVTARFEFVLGLTDANGNERGADPIVNSVKRSALRTGLVLLALALAVTIPSFGLFISLIGSLFSTALAFVFPTLFHMKVFSWPSTWPSGILKLGEPSILRSDVPRVGSLRKYAQVSLDAFVCLFGIVATIICTIVSLINIIEAIKKGEISWSFQTKPSGNATAPFAPGPSSPFLPPIPAPSSPFGL